MKVERSSAARDARIECTGPSAAAAARFSLAARRWRRWRLAATLLPTPKLLSGAARGIGAKRLEEGVGAGREARGRYGAHPAARGRRSVWRERSERIEAHKDAILAVLQATPVPQSRNCAEAWPNKDWSSARARPVVSSPGTASRAKRLRTPGSRIGRRS